MSQRILVVDDDTDALEVYKTRLTHAGFEVETAESAEKALGRLKAFDPTLIVTDVRMSGMTGLELLDKVRTATEGVDVVVMTGHDDMSTAVEAMKEGAFDYLVKPVSLAALEAVVDRCLAERDLRAEVEDDEDGEEASAIQPGDIGPRGSPSPDRNVGLNDTDPKRGGARRFHIQLAHTLTAVDGDQHRNQRRD